MRHPTDRRGRSRALAATLVLSLSAAVHVQAAGPVTLNGPSIATVAQPVQFTVRGLPANAAVSVAVTTPGGQESHHGAVAKPDGTLDHALHTAAPGLHRLRVLDSGGRELAAGVVHVRP